MQRRIVLTFHGKSVLDSKMMVEGIRQTICVQISAKNEAGRSQTRMKAFEIIWLPSRLIQRRIVLPFYVNSVLESKMMVEGKRQTLCVQIFAKKEGRTKPNAATKSTKAFEIILSSLSTDTKANCLALSHQKRSWFEYDGKRRMALPLCQHLRQEGRQGEPKHSNQKYESLWNYLSSQSTDTKATCFALSRQKRSWFGDDGRRHMAKLCVSRFASKSKQGEPKHVRKPLKLSLLPVDWYKGELSCPFTANAFLIRRWW